MLQSQGKCQGMSQCLEDRTTGRCIGVCCECYVSGKSESVLELLLLHTRRRDSAPADQVQPSQH